MQDTKRQPQQASRKPRRCSTIRAFFFEPIIGELLRHHAPIDKLLRKQGLSRADLRSPYARLPLRSYIELMEDAAVATSNPYFGLELGSSFRLQMLGPICAIILNAGSLREVLGIFETFQTAWQANTNLIVTREDDTTVYSYGVGDPSLWPRRQDAEFTISAIVSLIRQLTTPRWTPVLIEFEHEIETREQRLAAFFKGPVRGSGTFNGITINNRDLDRPLPGASDDDRHGVIRTAERHLMDLMTGDSDETASVSEAVATCISRRLGGSALDIDVIAKELNLSARSLRRKLELEGTSFREMLQSQRKQKAEKLLLSRTMQVSELASRLGYSDIAVFSRAFKTWTGLSPKQFAKRAPSKR
ncbi:AraC family transcriptional regulator [Mesorhizobium sp. LHD-90]|uniref:AraC family transcriptional regulator n=1 Tax=Mesorhizobium sp. LHD-90 TaxID=3071414 RepID=UPI0027DFAF53|nr:AraC family transcriptional regulator [Mesorhizobium sp. LHD-90]MDQ6438060.1 AraC family transcriptional regulator [Mesorhizobium sp. LHD-90]